MCWLIIDGWFANCNKPLMSLIMPGLPNQNVDNIQIITQGKKNPDIPHSTLSLINIRLCIPILLKNY